MSKMLGNLKYGVVYTARACVKCTHFATKWGNLNGEGLKGK